MMAIEPFIRPRNTYYDLYKNRISVEQSGVKHNSSTIVLQSYFRTYAIASVLLCTGLCRGGGIRLGQGGKSEIAHRGAERQHESLTLYLLQSAKACPVQDRKSVVWGKSVSVRGDLVG